MSTEQRKKATSPASTGEKQVRGDIATRFAPGQSGNPAGRKQGSRNRLSNAFVAALVADFEEHGPPTIVRVRENTPAVYLRLCASLMPKQIEIGPENPFADLTDEELAEFVEDTHAQLRASKRTRIQ